MLLTREKKNLNIELVTHFKEQKTTSSRLINNLFTAKFQTKGIVFTMIKTCPFIPLESFDAKSIHTKGLFLCLVLKASNIFFFFLCK